MQWYWVCSFVCVYDCAAWYCRPVGVHSMPAWQLWLRSYCDGMQYGHILMDPVMVGLQLQLYGMYGYYNYCWYFHAFLSLLSCMTWSTLQKHFPFPLQIKEDFGYIPRAAVSKFIELCDICSLLRPRKSRVLRPLAQHECFSENTSSGIVVKATKHLKPKANSGKNGEKQQDGMATNGKKREQGTSTGILCVLN